MSTSRQPRPELREVERPEEVAPGLKQYQRDALTVLRARLDPTDPGFNASDEVRKALEIARLYLGSHVLPLIDVTAGGGYYNQRNYVAREANYVRLARTKAK